MNKIILLISFIAIMAVNVFFPGDGCREGKLVIFYLAGLLVASGFVYQKIDKPLGVLFGYASVIWFMAGFPLYALTMVGGAFTFLFLARHMVLNQENELWLMLRIAMLLQSSICMVEVFGFHPLLQGGVQGTFGHPMASSVFFAMLFPICLEKWSKVEAALMIVMVIVAGSSCGMIGLISAALYYYYRYIPRAALLLFSAVTVISVCGAIFFPTIEVFSFSGRFLPWGVAYRHILHDGIIPLLIGHGPGSWFGLYNQWGVQYARVWDYLHSDPLQLVFELGIVGGVVAAYAALSQLLRSPTWVGASMVAMLANSFGAFPFHLPVSAFLFCVLIVTTSKYRNDIQINHVFKE